MNNQNDNRRFGKIIYSKSSVKAPKFRNFSTDKKPQDFSIKAYDRLIKKTKKTIDECKKQLNDDSYFNNNEFFTQHKKAQLIKFNKGMSEYRYDMPPVTMSQDFNNANRNMINNNIKIKDMNRNLYNEFFNSHSTNFRNEKINDLNEINDLRKKNSQNEKIILEKEKERNILMNKIKELETIVNEDKKKMTQINDVNKNNILVEKNFKEDKNKNEQNIKKLKGEIKEYLNIIEEQNKKIDLIQKDLDRIKQENYKYKSLLKNKNTNENRDFDKLAKEYNDSCRLNEILGKQNDELKNSKELLVKENYNLGVIIDSFKKENSNLKRNNSFLSRGVEDFKKAINLLTNENNELKEEINDLISSKNKYNHPRRSHSINDKNIKGNSNEDKIKNEYAILQKKFNDILRENSKFKNEKENINQEINKLNIEYNKMQVDNASLTKKNKEMKERITKLKKDNDELEQKIQTLEENKENQGNQVNIDNKLIIPKIEKNNDINNKENEDLKK